MTDYVANDLEELVRSAYQSAAQTVRPEDLRRTSPMLATAGPASRPRRINSLVPFAAAAAVIAAVAGSVVVPRLLTGALSSPGTPPVPGVSTYAPGPGHRPPFQLVLTVNNKNESTLLVESSATGHVLSSVPPPRHGDTWEAVSATGEATKFVLAGSPSSAPYRPTTLYTLTLSAGGTVTRLAQRAGSPLPEELISMAASADGSTVAYTAQDLGNDGYTYDVGVLRGGKTRQWTMSEVMGMSGISVSGNGSLLVFSTNGLPRHKTAEEALWVLPTSAPPGSAGGVARKVHDYTWVGGAGHARTVPESALISQDGSEVYVSTFATAASGKTMTSVTAYRTADGASLGAISTWNNGYPTELLPAGGLPLVWLPGSFGPHSTKSDNIAYLLNPATRTRTTLQLHGIPSAPYVALAW